MDYHNPVLLEESVRLLNVKKGGIYVDVTYGGGGHSREILKQLGGEGRLYAFDRDADAHAFAAQSQKSEQLELIRSDFKFIEIALGERGVTRVDGILADLGISSWHIDKPERGFSFKSGKSLDMRMDQSQGLSAVSVINEYEELDLGRIFRHYGELKAGYKIARAIVHFRSFQKIETPADLENALGRVIPLKGRSKFLAQLYQAIRIEVNGELESLQGLLAASINLLKPGGRIAIISYHSLEDRMVKRFFRFGNFVGKDYRDMYGNPLSPLSAITRRAVMPNEKELEENPRGRSARLRAAERTAYDDGK